MTLSRGVSAESADIPILETQLGSLLSWALLWREKKERRRKRREERRRKVEKRNKRMKERKKERNLALSP